MMMMVMIYGILCYVRHYIFVFVSVAIITFIPNHGTTYYNIYPPALLCAPDIYYVHTVTSIECAAKRVERERRLQPRPERERAHH